MNKSQSVGIWIVVALLVLSLVSMLFTGTTTTTKDLSYSDFLGKVKNSEIKSIEIEKDMLIAKPVNAVIPVSKENKLQQPATLQYRVMIPLNDNALYPLLEANKVNVGIKKPSDSSSILGFLGTALPLLLIIGIFLIPIF